MMNIAEKIIRAKADYDAVYESGQENGKEQFAPINAELEKCLAGEAVEGKTWYDEFWDNYQDYGNRTLYVGLFMYHPGSPERWFKPKYDMYPTNLYMFTYQSSVEVANLDFVEWFNKLGIKFDTRNCLNFQYAFHCGSRFGVIDAQSTNNFDRQIFWGNGRLHTIDELKVHEGLKYNDMTFSGCSSLKHMIVSGTIGQDGFNVKWSKLLSHDSIESIINALSTTTTGLTVTFSKIAVDTAFETSEGLADGTSSDEWKALIATKPNWTISLV